MSDIEHLVAMLKDRGMDVSAEQAEAMAVRIAGSVPAYLEQLRANDAATADYKPMDVDGEVSDKFKEPVAYEVIKPGQD